MKPIVLNQKKDAGKSLYLQIYNHIKKEILSGSASAGEKLPSLRRLSKDLDISITTSELAYNQLLVEGYIVSKPQSGYYVASVSSVGADTAEFSSVSAVPSDSSILYDINDYTLEGSSYQYDLSCFDFNKWKKCSSKVFNEYSHLLLFESNPQGEAALRFEIAKYLKASRGVTANPDQIVIGAGTQQITSQLARILRRLDIHHVSLESPGYLPVQRQFADGGFNLSHIPVGQEGIDISRLPVNIPSAVYVSPSNQFPTGTVMPVGRRYELLQWAQANSSIIIEDDYDSELRYFGKPVPALQSLDSAGRVVYLGSFSSTLFPAIKISYMVLPPLLSAVFEKIKDQYTQTCSKAEQLTLAFFMEDGHYYTGIKRLRSLYAQKLQAAVTAFSRYGKTSEDGILLVSPVDTQSGITLTLRVRSSKPAEELSELARSLQLQVIPLSQVSRTEDSSGRRISTLIFYYNQVPLASLDESIRKLLELWNC